MSDSSNILNELLASAASAMRSDWERLVAIGTKLAKDRDSVDQVATSLSRAGKIGADSLKRKLVAIQHMQNRGYSEIEIAAMGQAIVLAQFQKEKVTEQREKMTRLCFLIPGSQKESVQAELDRVRRVLGLSSSEQLFDFIISQLQQASDEDLKHSAGGAHAKG